MGGDKPAEQKPIELNPLDVLKLRILNREPVQEADINQAFEAEEQIINQIYDRLGEKEDSPVRKDHAERLLRFREKMKKENTDLDAARLAKRVAQIDEFKRERSNLVPQIDKQKEKFNRLQKSYSEAVIKTREAKDSVIGDYEGSGDDLALRYELAGYAAGMEAAKPGAGSNEAFAQAHMIYDKSDEHFWNDKVFTQEDWFKKADIGKHFEFLKAFSSLAADNNSPTRGFLAAYLKASETMLSTNDDALYREYFLATLGNIDAHGGFSNGFDLAVLNRIKTPKEWQESLSVFRGYFSRFKESALRLSRELGCTFIDTNVQSLLAKNPDQITNADTAGIEAAKQDITREAMAAYIIKYNSYVNEFPMIEGAIKKFEAAGKKAEQIKALKDAFDKFKTDLEKLKLPVESTYHDLVDSLSQVGIVKNEFDVIKNMISTLEREEDKKKPEDKEKDKGGTGGAGGGGDKAKTDGGDKTPEKTGGDKYKEGWAKAEMVDVDVNRYMQVKKTASWKTAQVRDENGDKVTTLEKGTFVELGKGTPENINILNVKGRKIDNAVFVEALYSKDGLNRMGWISLNLLEKRDDAPVAAVGGGEREKAPIAPAGAAPEKFGWMAPLNPELIPVYEGLDDFGKNPSKYPNGYQFDLKFNKQTLPCRVVFENGKCVFTYFGGKMEFPRLIDFMANLNNGMILQRFSEGQLLSERHYEQYENKVGALREAKWLDDKKRTINLQLDWDNPNPIINVNVYPGGRMQAAILRENVGVHGEELRTVNAENFDDFMQQLGHIKEWAEGPQHSAQESPAARNEILYKDVTDPANYFAAQDRIGRVMKANLFSMEEAQKDLIARSVLTAEQAKEFPKVLNSHMMVAQLDWGGDKTKYDDKNPALVVGVLNDGHIAYRLIGHGKDTGMQPANNLSEVFDKVSAIKKEA